MNLGLKPPAAAHLLFVCAGNICRSPMAERLTRAYAIEHDLPWLTASSAGVQAIMGSPMDAFSEAVLRSLGGDGAGFRSRRLITDDVAAAQLVLTMTTRQRAVVLAQNPGALRRTFTLLEAARLLQAEPGPGPLVSRLLSARAHDGTGGPDDVADPYRAGVTAHREAGDAVARALALVLPAVGNDVVNPR